eukprot:1369533-Amphidinium_carterae.1
MIASALLLCFFFFLDLFGECSFENSAFGPACLCRYDSLCMCAYVHAHMVEKEHTANTSKSTDNNQKQLYTSPYHGISRATLYFN